MDWMQDLEPKAVFGHFAKLCEIPHGSYNMDEISDYLYSFAKELKLWCKQDEYKNVLIRKPATKGYENVPAILLQGHMDMVAVKEEDCTLDLAKDGLELDFKDGYLFAKGTSLGGDDGIALAYAMAILEADDIAHPAIEVLFTVNEEVGMDGAIGVDLSEFTAGRLLNIDSEEEGILLAGCAGGTRVAAAFMEERTEVQGDVWNISLKGFQGGHSGADIHKWRGNAICLLGRCLDLLQDKVSMRLISINGGEKDNAIPRFAQALVCVPEDAEETLRASFAEIEESLRGEFIDREASMKLSLEKRNCDERMLAFSKETTACVSAMLASVFDGVITMSAELEGIVETSLNLGVVSTDENTINAVFALRSSKKSAKDYLARRLTHLIKAFGGNVSRSGDYPAWEYRVDSPLRDKMVRIFKEQYDREPVVTVIHAGLECGILLEKKPELDAISFGPDILDIHTTRERLDVKSVERTWKYILAVLADKE